MAESTALLRIVIDATSKGASKGIGAAKKGLGSLGKLAGGLAVGGLGAVAIGVAGIGTASLSMANQLRESQTSIQAALGTSAEEAKRLGDVALGVFGNNFGASVEDVTGALIEARTQLGEMSDTELKGATESAFRLSDAFGLDVGESLSAVRSLTEEFGLTTGEAFDFITTGMQSGLNASDDFLDTIGEYSNLFAEGGSTADQFFSLMDTGMTSGVLGTDKAADAFKEFQLRFLEGGTAIEDAFASQGESHQEWIDGVSNGSMTTADAFADVIDMLGRMEDPVEANRLGVELMGSQFEDLGLSAITALSLSTSALEDTAGATEALDVKYNTLASGMEGLKRQALVSLAPIGDILLKGINAAMPTIKLAVDWFTTTAVPKIQEFAEAAGRWIAEFVNKARPIVQKFSETWSNTLGPAMVMVRDALSRISAALGTTGSEMTFMDGALWALEAVLKAAVLGLQAFALGAQGVAWAVEKIKEGVDKVAPAIDKLKKKMSGLSIPSWLMPGSPPPLFHALQDITKAVKSVPSFDDAFGMSARSPIAGASGAGQSAMVTPPAPAQAKSGFSIGNITIHANNAEDGKRAGEAFVEALNSRGILAGI